MQHSLQLHSSFLCYEANYAHLDSMPTAVCANTTSIVVLSERLLIHCVLKVCAESGSALMNGVSVLAWRRERRGHIGHMNATTVLPGKGQSPQCLP